MQSTDWLYLIDKNRGILFCEDVQMVYMAAKMGNQTAIEVIKYICEHYF